MNISKIHTTNASLKCLVVLVVALAFVLASLDIASAFELSPGWAKIQHDINNSGKINTTVGNYTEEFLVAGLGAGTTSNVAVNSTNELLYIGGTAGFLRQMNFDGTTNWDFVTNPVYTTPVLATNNTVYVVDNAGVLYGVDSSGNQVCSHNFGNTVTLSSPVLYNNVIYFGTTNGDGLGNDRVYGVYTDCTVKWTSGAFTNDIKSPPAINLSGGVYVGSVAGGYPVYALDDTGALLWRYTSGIFDYTFGVSVDRNGTIYYGEAINGHLVALNKDGTLKWSYAGGSPVNTIPAFDSDGYVYYTASTVLVKLNPDTGANVWTYNTGSAVGSSSPAIDGNNTIYFGTVDKKIHGINSDESVNATINTAFTPTIGYSISTRGVLYVPTDEGRVYAYGYGNPTPPAPPVVCCDPSGFVFDQLNNPVSNVKVVISNATYTDPCLVTSCYTNSAGLWNGTIYADGTYTVTASKQGYNTNVTIQSLTIGGTADNIILNGSQATLTGHVYTNITGTGTTAIKGDLKDLRIDSCGLAGQGGTLTIGTTAGSLYVLKLIDVDSGNQQSVWQLLKDGTVIYDNVLVNTNEPTNLKIYETFYENAYVGIRVSNVFQGSSNEFNTATTCGSFEHIKKSVSIFEYLLRLASDLFLSAAFDAKLGGVSSQATIANWGAILTSTDGSNIPTSPLQRASQGIFFNASAGKDVVGYVDFHVDNRATIFNFNMAFSGESTTGNAGKLSIGYTDNAVTSDNGFTDVIMVNQQQSCQSNMNGYCTPQHDFKSIDADGDGTIRVWFKFNSGYSNFWLYEFYLNAWGATQQVPLPGVFIYTVNGTNTTTTDSLGAYTLYLSLKNNTVYYTKIGYESKSYTFLFNATNVSYTQDVVLNVTNGTINSTKEYIIVPNFVQGVATNGNYKTLGHTSLLGGYQISICPQLGGDCKTQSVQANTESTFALDPNLAIGTYKADMTGYLGGLLDITRDVIVSTNFTVTSATPRVDWANGADGYFLGDTMVLSVYVPTGTKYVNVTYLTNGSRVYSNAFSATGTVQNTTFSTNANLTISSFQPGQYQACIDDGNCASTTLYNTSNTDYTLSAPANANDGETFNILWKSPHTSTLQIVDQVNNIRFTQEVPVGNSLTGSVPVDTTVFSHEVTSITTTLNRNGVVVATAVTNITINPGSPSGSGNNLVGQQSKIFTLPWIGLVLLIVVIFGLIKNQVEGRSFAFAVAITTSLEALFGLWNEWGIYITIFSWLLVGVFLKIEKTVED